MSSSLQFFKVATHQSVLFFGLGLYKPSFTGRRKPPFERPTVNFVWRLNRSLECRLLVLTREITLKGIPVHPMKAHHLALQNLITALRGKCRKDGRIKFNRPQRPYKTL